MPGPLLGRLCHFHLGHLFSWPSRDDIITVSILSAVYKLIFSYGRISAYLKRITYSQLIK